MTPAITVHGASQNSFFYIRVYSLCIILYLLEFRPKCTVFKLCVVVSLAH